MRTFRVRHKDVRRLATLAAAAAVAIVHLAVPAANAGVDLWTRQGLPGGSVRSLAIDPTDDSILYAGTMTDGVYKSTDAGASWVAANDGVSDKDVRAIAVDPVTTSVLYAAVWGQGVHKSTDSGRTWVDTGMVDGYVNALAIDPGQPSTVYVAVSDKVWRTDDGGGSWSSVSSGLPGSGMTVTTLAIHRTAPNVLYAGTELGMYKLTDGAEPWVRVSAGIPDSASVMALAIDPSSHNVLYAGTYGNGLYKSSDDAGTWTLLDNGLTNKYVGAVAVSPTNSSLVYTSNGAGVFSSTDAGGTWASAGLSYAVLSTQPFVNAFAIDSRTPSAVYAATSGAGVYKSTAGGSSWERKSDGLKVARVTALAVDPVAPSHVYAGTDDGVYASSDGGETWTRKDSGLPDIARIVALAIDPTAPSVIYAAARNVYGGVMVAVYKSTNGGEAWLTTGLSATSGAAALAIDPSDPSVVYAGTGEGVSKSTNGGETWTSSGPGNIYALAIDPVNPAVVYAVDGNTVKKSTNGGGSWSSVWPSSDLAIWALAIDPGTPSRLYAGTAEGLYRTTNGGGSWALTTVSGWIPAVAVDPGDPSVVYTATAGYSAVGVSRSTDAGDTWQAFNVGMGDLSILSLGIGGDGRALYAGTDGHSSFGYARSVPAAPIIGTASRGKASATVDWDSSGDVGGSAITSFVVEARRLATGATTRKTVGADVGEATVTGLVNGAAYRLRVQAANVAGSGPFSDWSNEVVPATVPGAPVIGKVTSGSTKDRAVSVTVSWKPPSSTGGSAIKGYTVTATPVSKGTRKTVKVGASTRRASIAGLTRGAAYKVTVRAVNAVGTGPASAKSNAAKAR